VDPWGFLTLADAWIDHTAPMCSVARAMVMSGTDSHVAMQQLLINEGVSPRSRTRHAYVYQAQSR
jgi:hypothetical protein